MAGTPLPNPRYSASSALSLAVNRRKRGGHSSKPVDWLEAQVFVANDAHTPEIKRMLLDTRISGLC